MKKAVICFTRIPVAGRVLVTGRIPWRWSQPRGAQPPDSQPITETSCRRWGAGG